MPNPNPNTNPNRKARLVTRLKGIQMDTINEYARVRQTNMSTIAKEAFALYFRSKGLPALAQSFEHTTE